MSNTLVIRESELPMQIELVGDKGERVLYLLRPAGRKFGACLNKAESAFLRALGKKGF